MLKPEHPCVSRGTVVRRMTVQKFMEIVEKIFEKIGIFIEGSSKGQKKTSRLQK